MHLTPNELKYLHDSTHESLMKMNGMLYKCYQCGWVHTSISMQDAIESIDGQSEGKMDHYLVCFRCSASSSRFVKAKSEDVPRGSTIQPVVIRTKTECYVIALARKHGVENEDIRELLIRMEKDKLLSKESATKLYAICTLERDWLAFK